MYAAVCFASVDGSIGKVDRSTLSQQSLMELLIFGLDQAEEICGSRDDPAEVSTWKVVICNDEGEIEEFSTAQNKNKYTGTLDLPYLPSSVTGFPHTAAECVYVSKGTCKLNKRLN
ncbi:hypothetical protein XU18_0534 [Perkinsela sp. CCAP 1560/4]|nr:hypothetical protein XU18_0534 [Perkinsela sp. CCAP 1560/4]|eukprot:KNH09256.1 hypothetical protein XU18_0534 [Perkinsela sp. CCAP 1560/4]